jgi:opacity protein-like surface antigen
MKKTQLLWQAFLATSSMAVIPINDPPPADSFLDHLTVSAQFGFNINARFGPRTTPDGFGYNFLDGYVLPDTGGGYNPYTGTTVPPVTQNWGANNAAQVVPAGGSPQQVLLHTLLGGGGVSQSFGDDPHLGIELRYQRELGTHGQWHYGLEGAFNYMNLCMSDDVNASSGREYVFSDSFVSGGTTGNTLTAPYSGHYDIGKFPLEPIIYLNPDSSRVVPMTYAGHDKFEADIWGLHLGPFLQHPLGKRGDITLSGGLAVALINASASWSQSLTVNSATSSFSGSGSGADVLLGYYVGANAAYHLSKRWDLNAGLEYQDVGTYQKTVGARQVQLDLSQSVYLTIGVSYKF